jgi:hypothetical protein
MRTITAISCAIIGVSFCLFRRSRDKDSQSLSGRMASQQDANQAGRNAKAYVTQCGVIHHDHSRARAGCHY